MTPKIKINDMFNLGRMGLIDYPKLVLKLKSILEKANITKVLYEQKIDDDTYFDDLTLIIRPMYQRESRDYNLNDYSSSNVITKLYNKINKLKGWAGTTRMRTYIGSDRKEIMINVGTMMSKAEIEIGCYIPDRNALILYYDIIGTERSYQTENDVLFFFVNHLVDFMKKARVKKKNLKGVVEKRTIEQFSVIIKDEIRNKENDNEVQKANIETGERLIVNAIKKIALNDTELESVKKMLGNVKNYIQKQVEDIKRLDFVKSVDLTAEGMKINVGDIFIRHQGENIYIGEFTMIIKPKKIKIVNNDHLKGDINYIHPHIDTGGTICYGSRKTDILKLLAQNEFKKLVHILYLYLKSYTEGDSYSNISYWRDIQENSSKRKTANGNSLHLSNASGSSYDEDEEDDDDE